MKNTEYSALYREYKSLVVSYKDIVERVIKNKFEMAYLWKYKDDYPADWKRKAVTLDSDRKEMRNIQFVIRQLKNKMRLCNINYQQK